jgi:hypothetical protein
MKQPLLALGVLLSATTFNAQASLTSYTANGVDLVRMQGAGFDVSFTKDGNLFQTLAASNANLVSQIAAVTPTYNDPSWGLQTIDAGDFNTSLGTMSWWGGKAFVNYLNNISYGGSNQWSLPGWTDTGAAGPQYGNNGTDYGFNVNPSSSPLAQLYYGELAKIAYYNTSGVGPQSGYGIFGNNGAQVAGGAVGPFSNVQSYAYWLGREYAPNPNTAWDFSINSGSQGNGGKGAPYYAWAVSPGQVAAVPVPGAIWLMGSGLLGLAGLKRRGHAG